MGANPFQKKNPISTDIHSVLSSVFSTKETEPAVKKENVKVSSHETAQIDDEAIHSILIGHRIPVPQEPLLPPTTMYNYINASVGEMEKTLLKQKMETFQYYQTPETHTVTKEDSLAYSTIFQNWRKGLSGLFANYRKANASKSGYAFYAYSDRIIYYFHTVGYNGCTSLCCTDSSGYALYASSNYSLSDVFDSKFKRDSRGWYLSGRSVLFILDTIINAQASTVCALPLILSKYPFVNGIITKPEIKIKSEKHHSRKAYRVTVRGWVLSEDILMLNASSHLEAKQVYDVQ